MTSYTTLNDLEDIEGKTVLLRLDLNVPVNDLKQVTDNTRIDRVKNTVKALKDKGAKIVILSHFGRPKGERKDEFSLSFLPPVLEKRWGVTVGFADDCVGEAAQKAVRAMSSGDVLLLENVRFHAGEEQNDPEFAQSLATLGDVYINDAFSAAHRAHASTEGIAHLLPAAAGLSMQAELDALQTALENPEKPVMAIVGGSKISTKLNVLKNIVKKADYLVLGGAMPYTFKFAQGVNVGKSLREEDMADEAREILKLAEQENCKILLPVDAAVVEKIEPGQDYEGRAFEDFTDDIEGVDMGPQSAERVIEALQHCKTVLWNGPLGVFEIKPFDTSTNKVAKAVAERTKAEALVSVAGGGDTVAALENAGVSSDFSYISTAGGAFLEWLEGKTLPGVAALRANKKAA